MTPIEFTSEFPQDSVYETPTFDPRGAFAWTLRAGEIARRAVRDDRSPQPTVGRLASTATCAAVSRDTSRAAASRCETPTHDPRCVFAWTLRAGEVARLA